MANGRDRRGTAVIANVSIQEKKKKKKSTKKEETNNNNENKYYVICNWSCFGAKEKSTFGVHDTSSKRHRKSSKIKFEFSFLPILYLVVSFRSTAIKFFVTNFFPSYFYEFEFFAIGNWEFKVVCRIGSQIFGGQIY